MMNIPVNEGQFDNGRSLLTCSRQSWKQVGFSVCRFHFYWVPFLREEKDSIGQNLCSILFHFEMLPERCYAVNQRISD